MGVACCQLWASRHVPRHQRGRRRRKVNRGRKAITDRLMAKYLIGGFATVTSLSVISAGFFQKASLTLTSASKGRTHHVHLDAQDLRGPSKRRELCQERICLAREPPRRPPRALDPDEGPERGRRARHGGGDSPADSTGNGLGADNFAIIWYKGQSIYGINGSGSPKLLTIDALKARGRRKIPSYGVGADRRSGGVAGWVAMHGRFGRMIQGRPCSGHCKPKTASPSPQHLANLEEAWTIYSAKYRDRLESQGWFGHASRRRDGWYRPGEMFGTALQ